MCDRGEEEFAVKELPNDITYGDDYVAVGLMLRPSALNSFVMRQCEAKKLSLDKLAERTNCEREELFAQLNDPTSMSVTTKQLICCALEFSEEIFDLLSTPSTTDEPEGFPELNDLLIELGHDPVD